MQVGSCDISELVLVGQGQADKASAIVYNSAITATSVVSPIAGAVITGAYSALGIDPVGRPGVYACPRDFEAIIIDRRTDWQLEKRLGIVAAVLMILLFSLKYLKK